METTATATAMGGSLSGAKDLDIMGLACALKGVANLAQGEGCGGFVVEPGYDVILKAIQAIQDRQSRTGNPGNPGNPRQSRQSPGNPRQSPGNPGQTK